MKIATTLSALLLAAAPALAQDTCPLDTDTLSVGNFSANVFGKGLTYDGDGFDGSLRYRNGEGDLATVVFAQGIWLGGLAPNGELAVAAQRYGGLGQRREGDFVNGPLRSTDGEQDPSGLFCDAFQISRAEIEAFQLDVADGRLDEPHDGITAWPGAGNPMYDFGPGLDTLAPFVDADGDGAYDPTAGDYPAVTGDRAVWWVMNDLGTHFETGSTIPLGVEVQGLLEGFGEGTDPELASAMKLTYRITNRSDRQLDSLYVALWQDVDLGCAEDDWVGSLPELNALYFYNVDESDGFTGTVCGGQATFGTSVPILVSRFLSAQTATSTVDTAHSGTVASNSTATGAPRPIATRGPNPGRPAEFYNVLRGFWSDRTPLTAAGMGYNTPGSVTRWMYPGNSADATGWSACRNGDAADYRSLLSARPTPSFPPGQSITVEYALFVIEDIPLPCPDADVIAEATERLTERLLARPLVSPTSATSGATARLDVYPNPSGGAGFAVRLPTTAPGTRLTIVDAVGRTVRSYVATGDVQEVGGLAPGLYVARLTDAAGVRYAQRVVVQ